MSVTRNLADRIARAAYYGDRNGLMQLMTDVPSSEMAYLLSLLPRDAASLIRSAIAVATASTRPIANAGGGGGAQSGGGTKVGVPFGTGGMSGVAQDAASLKYFPANGAQWTTTLAAAAIASGNPSLLWLLQEASGNAADSIGAFTGTAAGTLAYQTAVPGYTTKGIQTTGGAAGTILNTAAGLPDISTTSMLLYIVMRSSAAEGGTRTVAQMGTLFGSDSRFDCTAASKLVATGGANTATGTATFLDGNVHPLVLKVDRTGGAVVGYSDQEKLAPAIGGSGKNILLGGDNTQTNFASGGTYMYAAAFFASAAEIADASVRTLLQTLGWTIAW